MTKNVTIAILGLFLLVISYAYFNQRPIAESNQIFEGNLECSKYIERENENINELQDLPINQGNYVSAPKIFYSPLLKTCVKAFSILPLQDPNGLRSYYIENLLTNDSILLASGRLDQTNGVLSTAEDALEKYTAKLRELEGN